MTNPKLIFKGDKLLLIDAPEMPNEKHFSGDQWKENQAWQAYQEALSKAPTWEIKDQKDLKFRLSYDYNIYHFEEGKLYDIPAGYDYKIEKTCKWLGNRDACANETCWDLNECQKNPTIEFAILIPQQEMKKEYPGFVNGYISHPKEEDHSHPLTIGQIIEEEVKGESQEDLWKYLENELIDFLRENEDKIIPMPTPISMDICIFLKSKFKITRR